MRWAEFKYCNISMCVCVRACACAQVGGWTTELQGCDTISNSSFNKVCNDSLPECLELIN